jgi:hypothetical protein
MGLTPNAFSKPDIQSQWMVAIVLILWNLAKAFITVVAAKRPDNLHRYADKSDACPDVMTLPDIWRFEEIPSIIQAAVPYCKDWW